MATNYKKITFRMKLVLLFTFVMACISLFIYNYFPDKYEQQAFDAISDKTNEIALMLSYSVSPAVFFNDKENIDLALENTAMNNNIVCIEIVDTLSRNLAYINKINFERICEFRGDKVSGVSSDGKLFTSIVDILYNNKKIGNLKLCISLESMRAEVSSSRAAIALLSLIIFVIGSIITIILSTILIKPIKRMLLTIESITEGDLTSRINEISNDEIGEIANSFNVMVDKLEKARKELSTLNKNLEIRVEERTRELNKEINEKKLFAENLEKSEKSLQIILDSMPVGVAIIGLDKKIKRLNSSALSMMGLSPNEKIFDQLCTDTFCPSEIDMCPIIDLGQLLDSSEKELLTYNGISKTIMKSAIYIKLDGEEVILETFVDITKQKKAQERLVESENRFRRLADSISEGITIIEDDSIVYVNKKLEQILGYTSDKIKKMKINDFIDEFDQKKMMTHSISSKNENFKQNQLEFWIITPTGQRKYVRNSYSFSMELNQKKSKYIVTSDLTEKKLAEEEIRVLNEDLEKRVLERTTQLENALKDLKHENSQRKKTQEELIKAKEEAMIAYNKEKELNELRTRFVSMVSHEYRTPLTVILTTSYIVEKYFSTQDSVKFNYHLIKIRDSVQIMTRLLENILVLGKTQSDTMKYEPTRFDIIETLKNILYEIKIADNNKHHLEFKYPNNSLLVETDQKILRQIIINLLSNAVKYSSDGTDVKVELIYHKRTFTISIADHGIGIPEEDLENIFEPFHRSNNVGNVSGTGLGLTIIKRCTEILDGKLYVSSKINEGTVFTVEIPSG